jgi:predicted DNA binding CopG/RHH family protein
MKRHDENEIVRTTLRLPRSLLRRVKISAASNETSMQDLIIRVLTAHCEKEETKR